MHQGQFAGACGIVFSTLLYPPQTVLAQSTCEFEVKGTTVPNTSGTPAMINPNTGTVISANFFNSGAIGPDYFDGLEFVSVCVGERAANGTLSATINSDIGRDNNTQIKAYPQFVFGTKFGNQYETSFRYYSQNNLPASQHWPVTAENLGNANSEYEFANLEYVSETRGIGLPAFTNNLPLITVTLDLDEHNVIGSERDVMLESWFYDTSANSNLIGNNRTTGQPVVNTLNNIVGIGHAHYPELDNTLLEMMVHIGALSPNDISGSSRNPGQNQLSENYSGKDHDGDGIDDHFDVDSHDFLNSGDPQDPDPGIYSSGIDADGDGIDDADILPVIIGDHAYSIWYGATFLAPIVIYSRETNSGLMPAMDLSSEGEITLPWNDFLEHTLNEMEALLPQGGDTWEPQFENPFPKMSASGGAIGGLEFGVEPQINNPSDETYTATVNHLGVSVDGVDIGLADPNPPTAEAVMPSGNSILPGTMDLTGVSVDDNSGVNRVRVRVQRFSTPTTTAGYWDGTGWISQSIYLDADLDNNNNATSWTLPGVNLNAIADYRVYVIANDNAGNVSSGAENPRTNFSIVFDDNDDPSASATSPSGTSVLRGQMDVSGISDDGPSGSGVKRVRVRILQTSPRLYWDGGAWVTGSIYVDADLNDNNNATTWTVPDVDLDDVGKYRVHVIAVDNAGNVASAAENPRTDFVVVYDDNEIPSATIDSPDGSVPIAGAELDVTGNATDNDSGIDRVRVRVQQRDSTPRTYWDGDAWVPGSVYVDANLDNNSTNTDWTLPDVDLTAPGNYRIHLIVVDNAGNTSFRMTNPTVDFVVQ